ncbi:hypothetical protein NM208_g2450 [Fusarium decemcellulare]|uniref:Uncharacterized protein n=1 Tax=Fusarium decemcellulare TaxID=57161 RepID=A0ACC1SSS9_9HYPO|nr:hypothetical protein NM208_g2450 [Fusarium decemcellulare]
MQSSVLSAFIGAIEASASVLLTIFYGVLAAQSRLLSVETGSQISRVCVKMFLPALLVVNLGSQIDGSSASLYVPILVWALIYNLLSIFAGYWLTRFFNFPKWFTPAIAFNNTTSLPLLLVQSLGSAGTLSLLARSDDDTTSEIIARAKSYFLVSSVVSNTLTFGLGGELLGAHDEDPVEEMDKRLRDRAQDDSQENGEDEENGHSNERTSLLPGPLPGYARDAVRGSGQVQTAIWDKLPPVLQHALARITRFTSPPAVGALIGVFLGVIPPFKKAFFAESEDGGIFNAWLTVSLKNIGELFVTLQVIIVGIKLSHSLRRMKRDDKNSNSIPWKLLLLIILIRLILWPVLSILFIRTLLDHTNVLGEDPVLWFALMMMPTGPPAMKLLAMAEADEADEDDKMAISQILMITYAISPLMSLSVVASLKASTG